MHMDDDAISLDIDAISLDNDAINMANDVILYVTCSVLRYCTYSQTH